MSHVYHVTIWESGEQVGDMGLYGDLGAALTKVHGAMVDSGAIYTGVEVSSIEDGLVNYVSGDITWTIDRRPVR